MSRVINIDSVSRLFAALTVFLLSLPARVPVVEEEREGEGEVRTAHLGSWVSTSWASAPERTERTARAYFILVLRLRPDSGVMMRELVLVFLSRTFDVEAIRISPNSVLFAK